MNTAEMLELLGVYYIIWNIPPKLLVLHNYTKFNEKVVFGGIIMGAPEIAE